MIHIKTFENLNHFIDIINKIFTEKLGDDYMFVTKHGYKIPKKYYDILEDGEKNDIETSIGYTDLVCREIIKELSKQKKNSDEIFSDENDIIKMNNDLYYFLRFTNSPSGDIERNFSGHMQAWVKTKEEAYDKQNKEKEEGRYFESEPKYDKQSDLWNYDPEFGISGYLFEDEKSFTDAMNKIQEIAEHHMNQDQYLCVFSAKEIGDHEGYDGEELFRDISFVKEIDLDTTYHEIFD
jgi:hypothetical protein